MTLHEVALSDKYDLSKERIFLSGAQAIIRMLLMQRERDRRGGLDTAGFVSRLSRLAARRSRPAVLAGEGVPRSRHIVFEPGLNEELAATACWGSQQAGLLGEGKHDGVFASGTARVRASTARATSSATPTLPDRPRTAACSL